MATPFPLTPAFRPMASGCSITRQESPGHSRRQEPGKIVGWAEVDLRTEFGLAERADVHFLMTTGYITQGQSALYLAETSRDSLAFIRWVPARTGAAW